MAASGPSDTAYVQKERGRVWIRMEIPEHEYAYLKTVLWTDGKTNGGSGWHLYNLLSEAEEEKQDRSDIMSRFDDSPALG